jgi:L-Ala-D/L-Glu epimerase
MSMALGVDVLNRPFRLHSLHTQAVSLPLASPLVTGAGIFHQRELLLLTASVEIDGDRVTGFGEVAPLAGWSNERLDASQRILASLEGPWSFDRVTDLVSVIPASAGRPLLHAGLELALLDALSRHAGQSLATTLMGDRGESVLHRIPVQFTLGACPSEETCRRVGKAREQGFRVAKLKVGAQNPTADLARIEQVLSTCPGISLRLDANGAWSLESALAMLHALPGDRVELVEQPVSPEFMTLLEAYDGRGPRVAADESCVAFTDASGLLDDGRVGALVIKPAVVGGLLAAQRLCERAMADGIQIIISNLMESAVGRLAAAQLAGAWPQLSGPHGLATAGWFARDLAPAAERIENGYLDLPTGPGIGFEPATAHCP